MTRITQGGFALLPDLKDDQIKSLVCYALEKGFAIAIEYTDDPHPRNCYWEMWGLPLFNKMDPVEICYEIARCRKSHPETYVKVSAFNNERGIESTALSFIVQRPDFEPGFYLTRQEGKGRSISYTLQSYAVNRNHEGARY